MNKKFYENNANLADLNDKKVEMFYAVQNKKVMRENPKITPFLYRCYTVLMAIYASMIIFGITAFMVR